MTIKEFCDRVKDNINEDAIPNYVDNIQFVVSNGVVKIFSDKEDGFLFPCDIVNGEIAPRYQDYLEIEKLFSLEAAIQKSNLDKIRYVDQEAKEEQKRAQKIKDEKDEERYSEIDSRVEKFIGEDDYDFYEEWRLKKFKEMYNDNCVWCD